jgi:hypothetical protein
MSDFMDVGFGHVKWNEMYSVVFKGGLHIVDAVALSFTEADSDLFPK